MDKKYWYITYACRPRSDGVRYAAAIIDRPPFQWSIETSKKYEEAYDIVYAEELTQEQYEKYKDEI